MGNGANGWSRTVSSNALTWSQAVNVRKQPMSGQSGRRVPCCVGGPEPDHGHSFPTRAPMRAATDPRSC